jgi:hypothetical protein
MPELTLDRTREREIALRARQALADAADWLETHDWCREEAGWFETEYGLAPVPAMNTVLRRVCAGEDPVSCCLLGAVSVGAARARRSDPDEALVVAWAAADVLSVLVPGGRQATWNDDSARTKSQVVELLRRGAALPVPGEAG